MRYRLLHGFFCEFFEDFYHCLTQVLVTVLRALGSALVVLSHKVHINILSWSFAAWSCP